MADDNAHVMETLRKPLEQDFEIGAAESDNGARLNVAQDLQPNMKELTARQRQVLKLLADGRTMKESATLLRVTPRTIAFHKYRIMDMCGLKTNSDLVRFAIREGLVSLR